MADSKIGFWSSETLRQRLPNLIKEFRSERVKHAAYELGLGGEAFVTGEGTRQRLKDGDEVVIPPGQFVLLITDEEITVPPDAIAFISMKSKQKFRGLINVSGFHVDPGFCGKLIFSAFNAGVQELHISKGTPLFMIWFASLDQETQDVYSGEHKRQTTIPDEIITNMAAKVISANSLNEELKELKQSFANWKIYLGILQALLIGLFFRGCPGNNNSTSSSPVININSPALVQTNMPPSAVQTNTAPSNQINHGNPPLLLLTNPSVSGAHTNQ